MGSIKERTGLVLPGLSALVVAAILAIYYSGGLVGQIWPDSAGYLVQALGIAGYEPFSRPGDRSIGYPLLLAGASRTPWPMASIVLLQAGLVVASFAGVYFALRRFALPRLDPGREGCKKARDVILAGLAVSALYSVIHVQIVAVLTEILFVSLVLLAVLAVTWFVMPGIPNVADDGRDARAQGNPGGMAPGQWMKAGVVAALAALPLAVKPHWLLAAILLVGIVVISSWLSWQHSAAAVGRVRRWTRLLPAIAVPIVSAALIVVPDRLLGERFSPREHALFGPRTAFCTHAHLMLRSLARKPSLRLSDDAAFDAELRSRLEAVVGAHDGGWRLLGYKADLCIYDQPLSRLLDKQMPVPRVQGRFLLSTLARVAMADPVPYARKVLAQLAHGVLSAFSRFAVFGNPGLEPYHNLIAGHRSMEGFIGSVRIVPEYGPLGTKHRLDGTLIGKLVHALLAVVFHVAAAWLTLAALACLAISPWRWRLWGSARRRQFLVFLALPLATMLGHHLLVALVHSFDVWRYGFNMFFVNLYFMGTSTLFWLGEWQTFRASRDREPARAAG